MLQSALDYASWGFAVFPLGQNSKIPFAGTKGVKDAVRDTNAIRALWLEHPHANVGVALGELSGVVAIDLDKGATLETLSKFPRTVTTRTKGGWHLYFKHQPGLVNTQLVKEGFNATLRSTGYYVVGVGSFVDGHEYQWESDAGGELSPSDVQFADLPAEFVKVKKTYGENTRHQMFVETATAMRSKGKQPSEVLSELHRRNREDCQPPKENCDSELEGIVTWVFGTVPINPSQVAEVSGKKEERKTDEEVAEHYINPLGFDEAAYYYTSSSNKQIVKLAASAHNSSGLLHLMPLQWWESRYSKGVTKDGESKGVDWTRAASDMLQACRDEGIFDPKKVRGLGCWREDTKLVVHLGDRLFVDGGELPLNGIGSRNIYELRTSLDTPTCNAASDAECNLLLDAIHSLTWQDPSHGTLFAGGLAVLRIAGALKWRPMLWLTGQSGSGKSTVMESIIKHVAGQYGVYIVGNSSEAGIRQRLKSSSQPVIFDESETDDKKSNNRMKGVLELIRQASSESDAQIVKGTADGKGHAFKVNSMFILSSVQVNLTSVQDINRFTVLELRPGSPAGWPNVSKKLGAVTEELGDKLFSRCIKHFATLQQNQAVFETVIAESTDMRTAQQYSILLAGFQLLHNVKVISEDAARQLVAQMHLINEVHQDKVDNEQEIECVNWLCASTVTVEIMGMREEIPVGQLIVKSTGNEDYLAASRRVGIDIDASHMYIVSKHPQMERIFKGTRWEGALWGRTLARIPGAQTSVRRSMGTYRPRTTSIPLSIIHS